MLATALLAFVIAMAVNAAKAPASPEKKDTQKQEQSQ